jgi:hypothetical protein
MKIIERGIYLDKMIRVINTPDIKVITGVRRSGKSKLLELQKCDGFEDVVNSIHAEEKYHIYITGSNAFLLSSDLATLFTGRTFEIKIYPFSFEEYMRYFELDNHYLSFNTFMQNGGMSGSYLYSETEDKNNYLSDIYNTLILRDIVQKYNIKK